MRVIISPEAQDDIETITGYIAAYSPQQAIKVAHGIVRKCQSLADFPRSNPVLTRYPAQAIRRAIEGNYLIFYRVDAKSIGVIRILHGAQDYESELPLNGGEAG